VCVCVWSALGRMSDELTHRHSSSLLFFRPYIPLVTFPLLSLLCSLFTRNYDKTVITFICRWQHSTPAAEDKANTWRL